MKVGMMSAKLKTLINAAQKLSPRERIDLISAVSLTLQHTFADQEEAAFWESKTPKEHIQLQNVSAVVDIAELRADFWPQEEKTDDLIAYLSNQRAVDRP
ncbi:hypothetical protein JW935_27815 [candidate division KSB1 bacterium]|nr:hypothetical protein [candidate division KSB1 bacterium]